MAGNAWITDTMILNDRQACKWQGVVTDRQARKWQEGCISWGTHKRTAKGGSSTRTRTHAHMRTTLTHTRTHTHVQINTPHTSQVVPGEVADHVCVCVFVCEVCAYVCACVCVCMCVVRACVCTWVDEVSGDRRDASKIIDLYRYQASMHVFIGDFAGSSRAFQRAGVLVREQACLSGSSCAV
jgi:hypothetical protein